MRRNKWSRVRAGTLTILAVMLCTLAAAASSYKIIHKFAWAHSPSGSLLFDAAGNLYGTAQSGGGTGCGGSGCGVVWELKHETNGTWTAIMLHAFTGADGSNPASGVIADASGNLYGTTQGGGVYGAGTVFKLTPNSNGRWTESVLYSFTGATDGDQPVGGLVLDGSGNFYGTALFGGNGCGVVFKLDAAGNQQVIHTFTSDSPDDGCWPYAGLVQDQSGNLYGTTSWGGGPAGPCSSGCGTVFKVDPAGNETVLHGFTGPPDGRYLRGNLIVDASGSLYGTSQGGGTGSCYAGIGCGTLFSVDINGNENLLYQFTGGSDGAQPVAALVRDTAGNFYGTTSSGGAKCTEFYIFGCGTVFKLDSTGKETVLQTFFGVGEDPTSTLILDAAGNLYGTTSAGTQNYGVIFKITP